MFAGEPLTGPCPPAGKPLTVVGPTGPKAGFKSPRQAPICRK